MCRVRAGSVPSAERLGRAARPGGTACRRRACRRRSPPAARRARVRHLRAREEGDVRVTPLVEGPEALALLPWRTRGRRRPGASARPRSSRSPPPRDRRSRPRAPGCPTSSIGAPSRRYSSWSPVVDVLSPRRIAATSRSRSGPGNPNSAGLRSGVSTRAIVCWPRERASRAAPYSAARTSSAGASRRRPRPTRSPRASGDPAAGRDPATRRRR